MAELHETLMGRKLIEGDIPRMIKALERIADALENDAKNQLVKAFLTEMSESDIDISDGEALDVVYEILLTGKHKNKWDG
tara:strand:+ start:1294 stop:1533 length:240 start_codon:yes stop_codon:yes gene_type:complete